MMSLPQLMMEENIEDPPVDFRVMLSGLARRWKLVVAVPLIGLIATAAVLRMIPAEYQSGVQILMFDPQLRGEAANRSADDLRPRF